jgi:hypothetical protein
MLVVNAADQEKSLKTFACYVHLKLLTGPGLRLAQPGVQQIGFLSSYPLFYLKTEAESNFWNIGVF